MLTVQPFLQPTTKLMVPCWATSYSHESSKGSLQHKTPFTQIFFYMGSVKDYIVALGDNKFLSLKILSHKLVVLLALTRPSRFNDIANLSLKAMRVLPDGVQFNPVCLSKQSCPSRPLKPFIFPSFSSDKRLCPKKALQAQQQGQSPLGGEGKDKLLLSYVKPHSPISSCSVARWIVTLLKLAGIDTDTFKSDSVRSASLLQQHQLELQQIKQWMLLIGDLNLFLRGFITNQPTVTLWDKQCCPHPQQILYKTHIDM